MKTLFFILWHILWLPGYVLIWVKFYLPIEFGRKRNVATTRRWFSSRHTIAPILTIFIYCLTYGLS